MKCDSFIKNIYFLVNFLQTSRNQKGSDTREHLLSIKYMLTAYFDLLLMLQSRSFQDLRENYGQ